MLSEKIVSDNYDYGSRVGLASSVSFTTLAFLNRLRPVPVFKAKLDYFRGEGNPNPEKPRDWYEIEMDLVGIEGDHEYIDYQEWAEDWTKSLAMMADDLTTRLNDAMEWFCEFGMVNEHIDTTHFEYPSVSPHEQNKHAPTSDAPNRARAGFA